MSDSPAREPKEPLVQRPARLTPRQWSALDAEAKQLGITAGELMRRVVDYHLLFGPVVDRLEALVRRLESADEGAQPR